jgi:hypothetical protein
MAVVGAARRLKSKSFDMYPEDLQDLVHTQWHAGLALYERTLGLPQ